MNKVAKLFTPQGDADPLAIFPGIVRVWQDARRQECQTLLRTVSRTGRLAIGVRWWADLVILDGMKSVQDAVCAPCYGRFTIKDRRPVSRRSVYSELY